MKFAASIVTFNPDLDRLKENIEMIYQKFSMIVIVDNNTPYISKIEKEYSNHKNFYIIKNQINVGIAAALNQSIKFCKEKGYEWVLTLDQDSICPPNIIEEYRSYIHDTNIALITPAICDVNSISKNLVSAAKFEFLDKCITSAALTKVSVWQEVDGFDEKMFIDLVDFDYCKRIRDLDYKIIRVNNVILTHEIGKITNHKFLKWNIEIKNHSAFRKYYMARNIIYYAKKHDEQYIKASLRVFKLFFLTAVYEKEKAKKIIKMFEGVNDAIRKR